VLSQEVPKQILFLNLLVKKKLSSGPCSRFAQIRLLSKLQNLFGIFPKNNNTCTHSGVLQKIVAFEPPDENDKFGLAQAHASPKSASSWGWRASFVSFR